MLQKFIIDRASNAEKCNAVLDSCHFALCLANQSEFNNTGYDGMVVFIEDDSDHYHWYEPEAKYIWHFITSDFCGTYQSAVAKHVRVIHPVIL